MRSQYHIYLLLHLLENSVPQCIQIFHPELCKICTLKQLSGQASIFFIAISLIVEHFQGNLYGQFVAGLVNWAFVRCNELKHDGPILKRKHITSGFYEMTRKHNESKYKGFELKCQSQEQFTANVCYQSTHKPAQMLITMT